MKIQTYTVHDVCRGSVLYSPKDMEPRDLNTNPDFDQLRSEQETFELMTAGYVGSLLRAARLFSDEQWNWSFSERTPTAREVCEHAFVWLWCDRQQMTVLDRSLHQPTPELPCDRLSMIQMLEDEAIEWRRLIRGLTAEMLDEEREPWEGDRRLIRSFLFHMGQHIIYKAGQIWMLAFELGLEGSEPYDAPYPNRIYGFPDTAPWPAKRSLSEI